MRRERRQPRADWTSRVEAIGYSFHSMDGIYWDERACYRLDQSEVDELEAATETLHALCLEAVEHVVRQDRFECLRISPAVASLVENSWRQRAPSLYGRFDLVYRDRQPPKLLEYNADTPTALFEASVAQWFWLQDVDPEADQFNSIHEKLIARWRDIGQQLPAGEIVHFACLKDNAEDYVTSEYLRDTASQAGLNTKRVYIEDIGAGDAHSGFVDLGNVRIDTIFKLYPWEWLVREAFGPRLLGQPWRILEPPWKMVLSNKGILPILWELFPGHPNLLPAYYTPEPLGTRYVAKPLYSREGANVVIADGNRRIASPGGYGREGLVYQAYCPLPEFDGNHAVIGSWVVGDASAGIGIREDATPITRDTSRFIPHYFA